MVKLKSLKDIDEFTEKNYVSLLYFGDKSCGVCEVLRPKMDFMIKKYKEVNMAYIEVSEVLEVTEKYSVYTFPAVVLYIGNKEYIREARFISLEELEEKIQRLISIIK